MLWIYDLFLLEVFFWASHVHIELIIELVRNLAHVFFKFSIEVLLNFDKYSRQVTFSLFFHWSDPSCTSCCQVKFVDYQGHWMGKSCTWFSAGDLSKSVVTSIHSDRVILTCLSLIIIDSFLNHLFLPYIQVEWFRHVYH